MIIPLLLTILSISGFAVFYNGLQHISLHSVHDIGVNTSMNIEPNCYSSFWTKEVTISNIKGYKDDLTTIVTFYKTKKSTLHKRAKQLNAKTFTYNPNYVTYRTSMNYFLRDKQSILLVMVHLTIHSLSELMLILLFILLNYIYLMTIRSIINFYYILMIIIMVLFLVKIVLLLQ